MIISPAIEVPERQLFEWDNLALAPVSRTPEELQLALGKAVNAIRELQNMIREVPENE